MPGAGATSDIRVPGLRLRAFDGDRDIPGMAVVMQAAFAADGLDWYPTPEDLANELAHMPNEDPRTDAIVADLEGRVVAFGRASWAVRDGRHVYHSSGEVLPELRRRGIGRAILQAEQRRLREIAVGHPDARERVFGTTVFDGQDGAHALLAGDGYVPVRSFAEMARSLVEPVESLELPAGLEIRPLRPEDRRPAFDAEAEAFRDHWGQREWTEEDFVGLFNDPNVETPLWRVAWDGDEVAGVVATYVFARENEVLGIRRAWLERVSVRRPWRRRGLASALLASAMIELRQRGFDTATLAVDTDNPSGAVGIYERLGFRRVRGGTVVERPMEAPGSMPGAP